MDTEGDLRCEVITSTTMGMGTRSLANQPCLAVLDIVSRVIMTNIHQSCGKEIFQQPNTIKSGTGKG